MGSDLDGENKEFCNRHPEVTDRKICATQNYITRKIMERHALDAFTLQQQSFLRPSVQRSSTSYDAMRGTALGFSRDSSSRLPPFAA